MLDRAPSRQVARQSRQRAYRARLRSGRIQVGVEVDGEVVNMLVASRWLREADACDRRAIGAAIARMLGEAAQR
jgi:hypothetical protein